MTKHNLSIKERFYLYVNVKGVNDCWEWKGGKSKGYGEFRLDTGMEKAHRAAWIIEKGSIPDKLCVLHSCDNRGCVNFHHLFLGTNLDNVRDRERKARGNHYPSNHKGYRILSEEQILEARSRYKKRVITLAKLANDYNVSESEMFLVIHDKWVK